MPTDIYLVKTTGFTVLIAVICCAQCCIICLSGFTAQQIARPIHSNASEE